ncbi:MAG: outer membrane protein assembly factor BamA [Myxococcota bacterium]
MGDRIRRQAVKVCQLLMLALMAFSVVASGGGERTAFAQPRAIRKTVDLIEVDGNRRVETEAIRRNIRQREGELLSLDQVSRDIRAIYALGFFNDVQADLVERDGDTVLIYRVTEKPSVLRIVFEGNDEIDDDDIKEVVNLRPFQQLDVNAINANKEKIEELYAEKGYFLTDVTPEIRPEPDNPDEVEVAFVIDEHAKIQVKQVTFLGNNAISSDQLSNIMETRPGGYLSFLTGFGTFKEASFEADLTRIQAFYYDKGYVDVKVSPPQVRLSRDKKYLFVTIGIDEGEQHFIEDVDIQGDAQDFIRPKEELMSKVSLKPDDVFSYGKMREDITALADLYKDDGYAYANISPIPRVDKTTHRVKLVYDIQKGQKVYFGRIEMSGNSKTRDKVLRRELVFSEGELYSSTAIKRSRARVQRLGFFETVDITTRQSKERNVLDVLVTVSERPTGTFQVGAGFSSVENFIATAQISQNNLFGRGQSLSLQATLSSIRTLFSLRFSEPYLFDSFWQFSFDVFDFEFIFNDFTRSSTGGNLTFGYPLTRLKWFEELDERTSWDIGVLSVNGTYKLEQVSVSAGGRTGGSNARISRLFSGGRTSSVRGSVFWDRRNNRLFPSSGFLQTGSVELADEYTGSQNEFIRYTGASRWYFPLVWKFVLKLNVEAGLVQSTDPRREVPIFERFFVGGPNSVRGFARATLGPTRAVSSSPGDPASSLSGFNIGGNKQMILNAEIEFPIFTAVGIRGVLFADAGNAFDDGSPIVFVPDLLADPTTNPDGSLSFDQTLRTAVGFGFRWFSPIGPLRFEWGIPLRRIQGEDPLVFEFSIGNSF